MTIHPGLPVHGQHFSKYCFMDANMYQAKVRMKQIKADKGNIKEEGFYGQIGLNKIRALYCLTYLSTYLKLICLHNHFLPERVYSRSYLMK